MFGRKRIEKLQTDISRRIDSVDENLRERCYSLAHRITLLEQYLNVKRVSVHEDRLVKQKRVSPRS